MLLVEPRSETETLRDHAVASGNRLRVVVLRRPTHEGIRCQACTDIKTFISNLKRLPIQIGIAAEVKIISNTVNSTRKQSLGY
jgi:hypothetical protein